MPELRNDEIAVLLRERLDTRQPRRLPERFVPPAQRSHRARWAVAVAAAFVLGLAIATVFRPQVGEFVNSVRRALPVTTAPQANPTAPGQPGATRVPAVQPAPGSTPEPTPTPQPSAGGPSGGGTISGGVQVPPTPLPSGGDVITLPLPPLPLPTPSGGIPVPVPSLPALPLPTPSGGGLLPPLLPTPTPTP